MAVLPGSLDYLYYNGILDHIPYEAYEMSPMTASGKAQLAGMGMGYGVSSPANAQGTMPQVDATQYLKQAQGGALYNTYTDSDTFIRRNNQQINAGEGYSIKKAFIDGEGYGRDLDVETMALGPEGREFGKSVSNIGTKVKDSVVNSPSWVKSLAACGVIFATACCLFKGKKPVSTPHAPEKNLFQKFVSLLKK